MNSRDKGKRGERQWRDELRANGYLARRGQQFAGSPESPDVICDELKWAHMEVKCTERFNIYDAMDQAARDAGTQHVPFVMHKRNFRRWLVVMEAETFFKLIREFQPQRSGDAEGLTANDAKHANGEGSGELPPEEVASDRCQVTGVESPTQTISAGDVCPRPATENNEPKQEQESALSRDAATERQNV